MNKEITDKVFNTITSNGCRDMEEVRFHQAVNEVIQMIKVEAEVMPANGNTIKTINEFFDDYFLDIENCLYIDGLTFKNKINFAALIVLQLKIELLSRLSV